MGSKFVHMTKRRVDFYFQAKGSKTAKYMGNTVIDSKGRFSKKFTAVKDGSWSATWETFSSTYVNANSLKDYVDVR
ncbi:hypothetical protein GCM10023194_52440 [Planotetraspora phitsanulokensis]|uniref:Uncharacterized protein n=2 Tax=Planotetraspora phitsanulokensis TaxID=575192 RepID=A0A8J3UF70_9ACTN|nr:hypothetical protein Pph01_75850 [Planotetraspora phitsanulokensis]